MRIGTIASPPLGVGTLAAWVCALALLVGAGGLAPSVSAAERKDPGILTLATDVRSGPAVKDAVVATLPANTRVTVLQMRGSQARISAGKTKGWVPAAKVRIGDGTPSKASSGGGGGGLFRGLSALLGGGGDGGDTKVTAGARGLTPGAIRAASPDPAARRRMEQMRVSAQAARKFASRNGLRARKMAYLSGATGGSGSLGGVFSGSGTAPTSGGGGASGDR